MLRILTFVTWGFGIFFPISIFDFFLLDPMFFVELDKFGVFLFNFVTVVFYKVEGGRGLDAEISWVQGSKGKIVDANRPGGVTFVVLDGSVFEGSRGGVFCCRLGFLIAQRGGGFILIEGGGGLG
jgi:hypothetical protein